MVEPTSKTKKLYMKKAEQLIKRYARETGQDWRENYMLFCLWLVSLRQTLASNSWRLYRASVIHYMKNNGPVEAVEFLEGQGSEACLSRKEVREKGRTSSRKAKGFKLEDFTSLIKALRQQRHEKYRSLADFLVASLFTGLRPSEWPSARRDGMRLIVRNGKYSEERACGEYRTLHLNNLSTGIIETIDRVISDVGESPPFERYQKSLENRLRYFQEKTWPQRKDCRVTLYACRHQFCANHKAAGMSLIEVAALMGHAVDSTSTQHYRRASGGWKRVPTLIPDEENMAMVRSDGKGRRPGPDQDEDDSDMMGS